jgi:CRP-like cAMP-binding protein
MADDDRAVRVAREVVLSTLAARAGDSTALAWEFRRISGLMEDLHLDEGEVVLREGEPPLYQFFVVEGEVTLTSPTKRDFVFGPRSVIGAVDFFLDRPVSYTGTITRKAHLLRVRIEDWLDVLEDSVELARIFITNLSSGLHQLRLRPPPLGGFDDPPASAAVSDGPPHLHLVDRILLMRAVPTFAHASVQTLTSLAELATVVHAENDELLAPSGQAKRAMLLVESGEVSATREAPALTGRFGPGMLVCGALAVTDLPEYEFRARARTRLLAIARDDFVDFMEDHFGLVRSTVRALLEERFSLTQRG